ncbi:hypothetical protein GCM10010123_42080 [Pilimelia anulata]|uniref:Uncharacterized protein n=1 Tax=Pilimelia anulata TaxID=53371 RepID=A0A8J3FCU1_9ACTN|nr:hypothetical protein [Pilimelia anulata]GGK07687.1 hypothetical protein GCM10010123_42080 [Pilimelia anulata]
MTGESYKLAPKTCKKQNGRKHTTYISGRSKAIGWCSWSSKKALKERPYACSDGKPYRKA